MSIKRYNHIDISSFENNSVSSNEYTIDSILSGQQNNVLTSSTQTNLSLDYSVNSNLALFNSSYVHLSLSLDEVKNQYPNGVLLSLVTDDTSQFYRLEQSVDPYPQSYFDEVYWESVHTGDTEPQHALTQITGINITNKTVSFSNTKWPVGSYERGYYNEMPEETWVTGNVSSTNYWSSHPRVRRAIEYGYGYLYGAMAGIDINVPTAHTRLHDVLSWLRDYEQWYEHPTDPMADGGFTAWIYRKNQSTPSFTGKPYDDVIVDTGGDNRVADNWFSTGRFLDFASRAYAFMVQTGAQKSALAKYLAPINAAVGQIYRWGYPNKIGIVTGGTVPTNLNANYHAQMLMGITSAYKIDGIYLVDDVSSNSGNVLLNTTGIFTSATPTISYFTDPINIVNDPSTSFAAYNFFDGDKFVVGIDFGLGNEQFVYKYNIQLGASNPAPPKGWYIEATNDSLGSGATDDKWFKIDYKPGEIPLTSATQTTDNFYMINTPALYRAYRITFTGTASDVNYLFINRVQLYTGESSQSLADEFVLCATTAMVNGQSRGIDDPFSGTWYRTYDQDSVPNSNPPVAYHDTKAVYHMQNWASLVNAYTVINDQYLKSRIRYGIRIGLDHMTKYRIQPDGTLSKWYLTTGGTSIAAEDQSFLAPEISYTRSLGMLYQIMLSEPTLWEDSERDIVQQTYNRAAQTFVPSRYFWAQAAEYNLFNAVMTSNTINNNLYFDLRD